MCKPGDQLQEKSDVCACQQGLFHQVLSHVLLGVQKLILCIKCKLSHKCYKAVFWIFFLIFCFSLLKYTYYYSYRSHISLQVAKLAKSAGVQILIFPTVSIQYLLNNNKLLGLTHVPAGQSEARASSQREGPGSIPDCSRRKRSNIKHIEKGLYRQKFSVQQGKPRGGFLTSEARMDVLHNGVRSRVRPFLSLL